jgi:hypothetical protein
MGNDNTELHNLIRRRLILPYLTDSFHSSFIEVYGGGLLKVLQKPDGVIHHILCGDVWRRCFTSLVVNATPIRKETAELFTSSYDNFIQTTGIRDGSSHGTKILSVFYDNLDPPDPNDLERPSGPPDHHRGLHYHRIRGSGPLLLFLSLISYSKLDSQHHRRIPAPISGNLYSKWYFPVMGGSSPLSLPPSTSQAPSLEDHIAKGQEEKGR